MTGKRRIQPGEKVGLKLSQAQRDLLLESLLLIPREVEEAIRSTPSGEPLMFTLDELDDLAGHVAAAANHAEDKSLREKLDRHLQEDRRAPRHPHREPESAHATPLRLMPIPDEPEIARERPSPRLPEVEGRDVPRQTDGAPAGIPDPLHSAAAWDQGQDRGGGRGLADRRVHPEGTGADVRGGRHLAPLRPGPLQEAAGRRAGQARRPPGRPRRRAEEPGGRHPAARGSSTSSRRPSRTSSRRSGGASR